jgi:hypothetical protein
MKTADETTFSHKGITEHLPIPSPKRSAAVLQTLNNPAAEVSSRQAIPQ